jgi:pimeloyl-ACP methyl ester carboxylesterase
MRKSILAGCISATVACVLFACSSNTEKTETQPVETTSPEIKSVFVNGDSLHYIDVGKGEPVIFVHGTLDDYRLWQMQIDTFAKKYRVIAYSRRYAYPNKREPNDSADYSVAIHAKDLAEFIKALDIAPVHLVGHSYGAYTALLTAKDHPELVKSLMLGEPPVMPLLQNVPGGDTIINNFMKKALEPAVASFRAGDDDKAISVFIAGVVGDTSLYANLPKEVKDQMKGNILELRGAVLSKNPFPMITCNDLKNIKTPTLIMTGERSVLFFKAINNELDKCLTNKETIVLANASHGLEMENPADFNKIVLAFIDKY